MSESVRERWSRNASFLEGKTIQSVEYLTDAEADLMGWVASGPVIKFTDGSFVLVCANTEGKAPGALITSDMRMPIVPALSIDRANSP